MYNGFLEVLYLKKLAGAAGFQAKAPIRAWVRMGMGPGALAMGIGHEQR